MGKKRKYEANPMTGEEFQELHEKVLSALHQLRYHTKVIYIGQIVFWRDRAVYCIEYYDDGLDFIVIWGFEKEPNSVLKIGKDVGQSLQQRAKEILKYYSVLELSDFISQALSKVDVNQYQIWREDEFPIVIASAYEVLEAIEFWNIKFF